MRARARQTEAMRALRNASVAIASTAASDGRESSQEKEEVVLGQDAPAKLSARGWRQTSCTGSSTHRQSIMYVSAPGLLALFLLLFHRVPLSYFRDDNVMLQLSLLSADRCLRAGAHALVLSAGNHPIMHCLDPVPSSVELALSSNHTDACKHHCHRRKQRYIELQLCSLRADTRRAGLGLAITQILLESFSCNVLAVSRTLSSELEALKKKHKSLSYLAGDVSLDADNKVRPKLC